MTNLSTRVLFFQASPLPPLSHLLYIILGISLVMADFTEFGLRQPNTKEIVRMNIDWKKWCSDCSLSESSSRYCSHWSPLLLHDGYGWVKLTQECLREEDLLPGSIAIARSEVKDQFCVGYLPANDKLRAFHQCSNLSMRDMWYLPPSYGSKRIVDIVHRKFAERSCAYVRKDRGCRGDLCVWLAGTVDEIMSCVLSIYTWMTRQPYDIQSGALKDSWKKIGHVFRSEPWHDFTLYDPLQPFTCIVPSFAQSAKAFSLARSERLKAIDVASTVEKATQCTEAEISSENTASTGTADTELPAPSKEMTPIAEEKLVLRKSTFTGLAESMNKLNMSDLTPPSSPDRLSFGMGEFLKNANVDFRWLGEGKGTTCNISIHIPPGGDLPAWLKDRAS